MDIFQSDSEEEEEVKPYTVPLLHVAWPYSRKLKLIFIDGEPGAGTTKVCSLLNQQLNFVHEPVHEAPASYIDLPRLVRTKLEKIKNNPLDALPACTYEHPYYTSPNYFVGWDILKLVDGYKKREQNVNPRSDYTVCDTSPFFILESLLPDAMEKNYIVQEVNELIVKAIWGLIAWLTNTYAIYRVWVERDPSTTIAKKVQSTRIGGYTTETSGYRVFKFQGLNKLAHPDIITFVNESPCNILQLANFFDVK